MERHFIRWAELKGLRFQRSSYIIFVFKQNQQIKSLHFNARAW